ncbi:ion transporter, partial [Akkermansiaceae bacterium]|nr:ion transporter [Akkermansiaceae bacterium]
MNGELTTSHNILVRMADSIVQSKLFSRIIIFVIVCAGVLVGLQTFPEIESRWAPLLNTLDSIILGIFTIEILLKMTAKYPKPWSFFTDGWNIFDFFIVAVCFLPFGGGYVAVLRLFRLLRVLRLITAIPRLQVIVAGLMRSLPSMVYVSILLFILFYVYAVVGVILFRANDPIHFGDLWTSLLSLFRVVTLEDWTDVMYLQIYGSEGYAGYNQSIEGLDITSKAQPLIGAAYFVSFVMLGTMIMLNLLIGIVVNGMDEAQKEVADRQLHELL